MVTVTEHSVNEMNAWNYLLHYAGIHTNIEKGVDYYYCYSTNKFLFFLAAHRNIDQNLKLPHLQSD